MIKLFSKGVYLINNKEFTGLNDVKPQMIEEATKNARATAEKFAKDSDSSLGNAAEERAD